jgi:signal transduction histidine kinase
MAAQLFRILTSNKPSTNNMLELGNIIVTAPVGICILDAATLVVEIVNDSFLEVAGKPREDVVGKYYWEPFAEARPYYEAALAAVVREGKTYIADEVELMLIRHGKEEWIFVSFEYVPIPDASGQVTNVAIWVRENTSQVAHRRRLEEARKKIEESEKSIRSMILQAPVAMCIFRGPSYLVSIANHKMIELWDKRLEDVLGKPIFEALPEAKDQGLEALLDKVYATGETFTAYERPVSLPRNGKIETVYVDFVYEALDGGDGQTKDILAVAIDVSYQVIARHKIEEVVAGRTRELAEANRNLERSNGELRQFAYITSHDLQEPLRKISTYTSLLEEDPAIGGAARGWLEKIAVASQRMQNLIRAVLSYSELSRQAPGYEPVDLNKIVEDAISEFDLLIEQKSAAIRIETLPTIDAIPLQMSQLFGNLLSNALKYARTEKPPVISITCRREDNAFHIDVSDNGIGFSPENADQIFSIFKRLHRKEEFSGTGIGLAMCKKIIENHGGSITATSAPGEGATFRIVLPVHHQ